MGGEEGRGPASGLPLPGSIYSLLPRQGCVKFDTCVRALTFSLYLPKEERYMGHRGVIFEFCLPRYPKLLVEWLRERRNEKMHSVCLHNNRGVWAESSLTYRERHSVSTQQVTEFRLSLSSLRSCHHDPGRGPAQAGLASAPAVRKRQRSPGQLTFVLHTGTGPPSRLPRPVPARPELLDTGRRRGDARSCPEASPSSPCLDLGTCRFSAPLLSRDGDGEAGETWLLHSLLRFGGSEGCAPRSGGDAV